MQILKAKKSVRTTYACMVFFQVLLTLLPISMLKVRDYICNIMLLSIIDHGPQKHDHICIIIPIGNSQYSHGTGILKRL